MADFFASGRAVDLVLFLMGLEALGLLIFWHWRSSGVPPLALAVSLAAGVCLLLAVRAALTGAPWPWVALLLIGSLAVHLLDLALRWTHRQ